jgi:hypothetical protein
MATIPLTLQLTPGQFVEMRTAMARSMREHEYRAAEEFGCSVHDSRIVRDKANHYMRSALEAMRECHEVRQGLAAALMGRASL